MEKFKGGGVAAWVPRHTASHLQQSSSALVADGTPWNGRAIHAQQTHLAAEVLIVHGHLPHLVHGRCAVHGSLEAAAPHQVGQGAQVAWV